MSNREPQDHLVALGRVATAAAHLELVMTSMLVSVLGIGRVGLVVVAGEPFTWTASKLEAIAKLGADSERRSAFLDALSTARSQYDRRNRVLHAVWVNDLHASGGRQRFKFSRGTVTVASGERMTVSDLHDLASDLDRASAGLVQHLVFVREVAADPALRAESNIVGDTGYGGITVGPPE